MVFDRVDRREVPACSESCEHMVLPAPLVIGSIWGQGFELAAEAFQPEDGLAVVGGAGNFDAAVGESADDQGSIGAGPGRSWLVCFGGAGGSVAWRKRYGLCLSAGNRLCCVERDSAFRSKEHSYCHVLQLAPTFKNFCLT